MISKVLNCSRGFTFQVLHIQSSHSHSVGLLSKFCASGRVSEVVICGCFFFSCIRSFL